MSKEILQNKLKGKQNRRKLKETWKQYIYKDEEPSLHTSRRKNRIIFSATFVFNFKYFLFYLFIYLVCEAVGTAANSGL
jgi:hypothetical protein